MVLVRKSILDTPEIVNFINAQLSPSESLSFACSSRRVFQTIMPIHWEHVNVSRLFKLLPTIDNDAPLKPLTENDLSRFNVYALWIKHLSVSEDSKTPSSKSFSSFCRYFPTRVPLPNLTTLRWSPKTIDPICFTTISTWPLLKNLRIEMDPYKPISSLPELPNSAFPSLTHLSIEWLPDCDAFHTFWNVPALVSNLTSVNLLPSGDMCREKNKFSRILRPILEKVVEKSPKVEEFRFRAVDPDAIRAWYRVPISTLDAMQKLPLRKLWIEAVELLEPSVEDAKGKAKASIKDNKARNDSAEGEDEEGEWEGEKEEEEEEDDDDDDDDDDGEDRLPRCPNLAERLSAMFPNLVELGFPRHMLPLSEIQIFHANMPNLEILRFDFELRDVFKLEVDLSAVPRQRPPLSFLIEANFRGTDPDIQISGISSFKYTDALRFAQYLYSLRPNVNIVDLPDDNDDYEDEYPERERMIELVNEYLEVLARCNQDPSLKYEDIGVLTEESWAACNE